MYVFVMFNILDENCNYVLSMYPVKIPYDVESDDFHVETQCLKNFILNNI